MLLFSWLQLSSPCLLSANDSEATSLPGVSPTSFSTPRGPSVLFFFPFWATSWPSGSGMVFHGGTLCWPTQNLQNCCGSLCQHNFSVLLSANTLLHRHRCWEWTSVVFKIIVNTPFQKATTTTNVEQKKWLKVRVKVTSLLNQLDPLLLWVWLWGSHSWTLQIKALYSWSLGMIKHCTAEVLRWER